MSTHSSKDRISPSPRVGELKKEVNQIETSFSLLSSTSEGVEEEFSSLLDQFIKVNKNLPFLDKTIYLSLKT